MGVVLSKFGYVYLEGFRLFSILLIVIGVIGGTFQFLSRTSYEKREKKWLYFLCFIVEGILALVVLVVSFLPLLVESESLVTVDGKMYIERTHSFLLANWVNYYDFTNPLVRSKQPRFTRNYNNTLTEDAYLDTIYYDKKGNIIGVKKENLSDISISTNEKKQNTDSVSEESNILYQRRITKKKSIRIVRADYILAQRIVIVVEKSTDGGKTYQNQLTNESRSLTVNGASEYLFIDEKVGFINDPGLVASDGENRHLLVTRDGGKTFEDAIIHLRKEQLAYLYIEKLPYLEDGILKMEVSLYNENQKKEVLLISKDNGVNWKE